MKECTACEIAKPIDDFYPVHRRDPTTLMSRCKTCCSESGKRSYQANREKRLEYAKAYQAANPESVRIGKWKAVYGLTDDEHLRLFTGACAVCGDTEARLQLDHCHATGKIRGFLCSGCNTGLGRFKDRIDLLLNAIDYLEGNS